MDLFNASDYLLDRHVAELFCRRNQQEGAIELYHEPTDAFEKR